MSFGRVRIILSYHPNLALSMLSKHTISEGTNCPFPLFVRYSFPDVVLQASTARRLVGRRLKNAPPRKPDDRRCPCAHCARPPSSLGRMAQIYAAINVFLITVLSNARTRLIPFRPQPCPLRPRHPADVHRRAIISINSFFFFRRTSISFSSPRRYVTSRIAFTFMLSGFPFPCV